jgi:DNA-binding response OmpR family regulator
MKILVVEDDPGCREMLHSHLNRKHELSLLTNGRNALALLADDDHGFDLVLLDLNMPRMSGTTLMELLNEWENLKVRFIIISGVPNLDHIGDMPNVLAVLRKPFQLAELDALLNAVPVQA